MSNWIQIHWLECELKLKEMRCKLVEKVLKICSWSSVGKKYLKKTQIWENTFPCLFTWDFQAGIWQEIILWDPIVGLPKPTLMNHGH